MAHADSGARQGIVAGTQDTVAEVTPIRQQTAKPPPPAAPPPMPAPPAPPDGSISFAMSKGTLALSIVLSCVLGLLLYVTGFFTALVLLVSDEPATAKAQAAAPAMLSAPPATEQKPVVPRVAITPAPQSSPSATSPTTSQDEASPRSVAPPVVDAPAASPAAQDDAGPAPPPAAPATGGGQASSSEQSAPAAPPPVPSRLADRSGLLRNPAGVLTPSPRPTLPPPQLALRRAGEAAAGVAAGSQDTTPPPLPAAPPEAKQLPATQENALLSPTPDQPAPPPGALDWTLQVGAFRQTGHADRLVQILLARGYSAYILTTEDSQGRSWYRVRLGSYDTRQQAQAAARDFKRREDRQVIAVRRLTPATPDR